jgi:hypothetical protein
MSIITNDTGASYGNSSFVGVVKYKHLPFNLPILAQLYVYRDSDGALVREGANDNTTGAYIFEGLDANEYYTIVAFDPSLVWNPVIIDHRKPTISSGIVYHMNGEGNLEFMWVDSYGEIHSLPFEEFIIPEKL